MHDSQTLRLEAQGAVLFVTIDAPPMNLIGPELVRDLVSLIEVLDRGEPLTKLKCEFGLAGESLPLHLLYMLPSEANHTRFVAREKCVSLAWLADQDGDC